MTFKLIYSADLHGNEEFYKRLLKKAEDKDIDAVVIGGDLCDRNGTTIKERVNNQKIFLEKFLIPLFKEFKIKNKDKEIYLIMGNDDFRINLNVLENAEKNNILKSIHKKSVKLNKDFSIAGYASVNPTPFRLKDWEKPEFKEERNLAGLFFDEVRSIEKEEGTISEDLNNLKKLSNSKETIYIIHAPPFNTKLDVVITGTHVGSKAVKEFIEKEQPLLTLHGHIHESPKMSGSWKDCIGKTICINVGNISTNKLNCVIINVEDLNNVKYLELQ